MSQEKNELMKHEGSDLKKSDLIKHWLLIYSSETAYNYERLQALGSTNAMVPIVRRLYKSEEKQAEELKKYMVFFNTEPSWVGPVIHGLSASMEEQRAKGEDIEEEDINSLRTGLMGPMAGIGDTISQGIVYPILAGIACTLALAGNILGPILFELVFKVLMLTTSYTTYMTGYKQGKESILKFLKAGTMNKLTEAFSIVGLMVVGNMAAERVGVVTPVKFNIGEVAFDLQSVIDSLLPGLIPLAITLVVWKLIANKMNPTYVILILFVAGFAGSMLGILSPTEDLAETDDIEDDNGNTEIINDETAMESIERFQDFIALEDTSN